MTKSWYVLTVLSIALLAVAFAILPERIFSEVSLEGALIAEEPKVFALGSIFILFTLTNGLLYYVFQLREKSKNLETLALPQRSFWLSKTEHRASILQKLRKIVSAIGVFVNLLVIATVCRIINFYYPQVPHLRVLSLPLLWVAFFSVIVLYTFKQLKKPSSTIAS